MFDPQDHKEGMNGERKEKYRGREDKEIEGGNGKGKRREEREGGRKPVKAAVLGQGMRPLSVGTWSMGS